MSDLRTAAKQALEFIRWSQFIPSNYGDFPEPPFTAPQVEAALHAALIEDAMQRFTDVNQELEAELADTKVDSQAIAKLPAEAKHS